MRVMPLAKNRKLNADDVARELRLKLSRFPGINVFVANPPSISIGGRSGRSTYQYTMQGPTWTSSSSIPTDWWAI